MSFEDTDEPIATVAVFGLPDPVVAVFFLTAGASGPGAVARPGPALALAAPRVAARANARANAATQPRGWHFWAGAVD